MSEDKPIDASSVVSPKNDVTLEIDVPVLDLLANVANTKEKIPLRTVVCNDVPMRFPEKVYIYTLGRFGGWSLPLLFRYRTSRFRRYIYMTQMSRLKHLVQKQTS